MHKLGLLRVAPINSPLSFESKALFIVWTRIAETPCFPARLNPKSWWQIYAWFSISNTNIAMQLHLQRVFLSYFDTKRRKRIYLVFQNDFERTRIRNRPNYRILSFYDHLKLRNISLLTIYFFLVGFTVVGKRIWIINAYFKSSLLLCTMNVQGGILHFL